MASWRRTRPVWPGYFAQKERRRTRDGLLETAVLEVMSQPTVELLVLRRVRILHADDDAQAFGEPHLGVPPPELLEELQSMRRQVVGLGRRQAEVRFAQPALGQ